MVAPPVASLLGRPATAAFMLPAQPVENSRGEGRTQCPTYAPLHQTIQKLTNQSIADGSPNQLRLNSEAMSIDGHGAERFPIAQPPTTLRWPAVHNLIGLPRLCYSQRTP
jgi:hypothetical protein